MSINKLALTFCVFLCLGACVSSPKGDLKTIVAERSEAEALYRSGDYQSAIGAYRQLLKLAPGLAETWLKLGNCYGRIQDFPNAIVSYEQALLLDPEYVKAWYNLSYIQAQQLANTVVDMYKSVPKNDPEAVKIRNLVEGVLAPFGATVTKGLPQNKPSRAEDAVEPGDGVELDQAKVGAAGVQQSDSADVLIEAP